MRQIRKIVGVPQIYQITSIAHVVILKAILEAIRIRRESWAGSVCRWAPGSLSLTPLAKLRKLLLGVEKVS
jgi:hypothetical protein